MFWLKKVLGNLLMPLPMVLILLLLGLLLLWLTRRQRLGKTLITLGVLLLCLVSLRPVSLALLRPLEQQYPAYTAQGRLDYILVLGHGQVSDPTVPAWSYGTEDSNARVAEAIRLKHQHPEATLVFSGNTQDDPLSCAGYYAQRAEAAGIPRNQMILFEDAFDTQDEIQHYASLVTGGKTAALVTSAYHMPRAMAMARGAGFSPTAAPTDFKAKQAQRSLPLYSQLPSSRFLYLSTLGVHERLGLLWTRLRGQSKD